MLSIAIVAVYSLAPSIREELTFSVAIVGGAAAVYTGYYVAATLRLSIENTRKQRAFEILRDMDQPMFIRIRDVIDQKVDNEKVAPEELYENICKEEDLRNAVTTQLDLFEDMAIAIKQEYVDEYILFLSLMRIIPRIYDNLQHYIRKEREHYNSDVIYSEFQRLAEAWGKHKSIRTGKRMNYVPS